MATDAQRTSLAREYYIRIGAIVPIENRPTLRLRPGEREKFEREALGRALIEQEFREGIRPMTPAEVRAVNGVIRDATIFGVARTPFQGGS